MQKSLKQKRNKQGKFSHAAVVFGYLNQAIRLSHQNDLIV
jgi:hypothetical protein